MKKRIVVAKYDNHINSVAFSSWEDARLFVLSRIDSEKSLIKSYDPESWTVLKYYDIVRYNKKNGTYELKPHTWELNEVEVVSAASK